MSSIQKRDVSRDLRSKNGATAYPLCRFQGVRGFEGTDSFGES